MTKKKKPEMWMKEAFKNAGKGVFHRQLGVKKSETIPMTFLQAIVDTKIGMFAHNPTQIGKKMIRVTRLVKRRAVPLLTADRINK